MIIRSRNSRCCAIHQNKTIKHIYMSSLKLSIPHQLTQQEALSRIKNLLSRLKKEQRDKVSNVSEEWNGETGNFSFTAKGFDLSGAITVHPSAIDIHAKIPMALAFFKGKIKSVIEEEAKELLA
jgi:hypothetical protein